VTAQKMANLALKIIAINALLFQIQIILGPFTFMVKGINQN
jgi:hypothetical protein